MKSQKLKFLLALVILLSISACGKLGDKFGTNKKEDKKEQTTESGKKETGKKESSSSDSKGKVTQDSNSEETDNDANTDTDETSDNTTVASEKSGASMTLTRVEDIDAGVTDYNYILLKDVENGVIYVHKHALVPMEYDSSLPIRGAAGEITPFLNGWYQDGDDKLLDVKPYSDYIFKACPKGKYEDYYYCKNVNLVKHQFNIVQVHKGVKHIPRTRNEERYKWSFVDKFHDYNAPGLCKWYFKGKGDRSCFDPKFAQIITDGPIK